MSLVTLNTFIVIIRQSVQACLLNFEVQVARALVLHNNGAQLNEFTEGAMAYSQLKSAKWYGKGFHWVLACNPLK